MTPEERRQSAAAKRHPNNSRHRRPQRHVDAPRKAAYDALHQVTTRDAYANLIGPQILGQRNITGRDAAFATELLNGTCRLMGTYDRIIVKASGHELSWFQSPVLDVLRLASHQLLSMRVATHAAVAASVDLGATVVSERVAGLVNAICRKIALHDLDGWVRELTQGVDEREALAIRTHHPRWIVDAYAEVLPADELEEALAANNINPVTSLVIRPGLSTVDDLVAEGAEPNPDVPTAAFWRGNPGDLKLVRIGHAGVQDPGSQLVALALGSVDAPEAPEGPWLDLCAGPGGKAALLAGLAMQQRTRLLASEIQPHRAHLVQQALRAYTGEYAPLTIGADGTEPAWQAQSFARVMADVPCSGLGALRRRPEARWRRTPEDVAQLNHLQADLLDRAIGSAMSGGVIAYVTCSPHKAETVDIVETILGERNDVERIGDDVQLWPHRDGTDAMFCALLRKR